MTIAAIAVAAVGAGLVMVAGPRTHATAAQRPAGRSRVATATPKADPLALAVSRAAGPGDDLAFSYGSGTRSAPLTLPGATTVYIACTSGHFSVAAITIPCDAAVHEKHLIGPAGTRPLLVSNGGHWALLARPGLRGS